MEFKHKSESSRSREQLSDSESAQRNQQGGERILRSKGLKTQPTDKSHSAKRRNGLLKKAYELLSVLCDAQWVAQKGAMGCSRRLLFLLSLLQPRPPL
ncbi:hypothetical protein QQ045_026762 [Rhodiola kirilowii]